MKITDKAIWAGMIVLVIIGYMFMQKNPQVPTPVRVVEKAKPAESLPEIKQEKTAVIPEKKPDLATFKGMVKTEINTDDEIFCARANEKIYFLPRQLALQITRERKNHIVLPKQYASCLKDGNWSFWVVEFDLSSRVPYRYYMKISLTIKNAAVLTPVQAKNIFQSQKEQFKDVYYAFNEKAGMVQFLIEKPLESNFAFHYTNTVENLYGSLRIEPVLPVGNFLNVTDKFKNETIIKNRYLSPSDSRLKKFEHLLPSDLQAIYTDSKFDLSVHNLSALFYVKHKKKIDIIVKKTPDVVNSYVKNRLISFRNFNRKAQTYFIVDVRTEKMTKSLSVNNSYHVNYRNYASNSYFLLVDYYVNFNENKLLSLRSIDQHIEKIAALSKEKPILLIGLGDEDPFIDYLTTKLPLTKTNSLRILKNGFYEALHRSYFFKNLMFTSDDKLVEPVRFDRVLTFLSLGY